MLSEWITPADVADDTGFPIADVLAAARGQRRFRRGSRSHRRLLARLTCESPSVVVTAKP